MRVVGLIHQSVPVRCAGAESHIQSLFRALTERGHQVDVVLSAQVGEPYTWENVNIWPTVDLRTDVYEHLKTADILIGHLADTTRATVLGHYNQIPVCVVHHNNFLQTREALRLPHSRTDLVAVNSQWMAEDLLDWAIDQQFELPPTVIVRPIPKPVDYRTTPGDHVTLINLRRHEPDTGSRDGLSKGGETFRALAELFPTVKFLGVTGAYGVQQELADLPNVEVIEHVPHDRMRELVYARTKILLVPSSYESWGRVAGEAICSGIPVIATPTPGLTEQLGDAGTYAPYGNIPAWTQALAELLRPVTWRKKSKAAKARANELADLRETDLTDWVDAIERTVTVGGFTPRPLTDFLN